VNGSKSMLGGGRQSPSLPTSRSQVPLHKRYEALDVEALSMDDMDDGPSTPEVLPRSERPAPVSRPPPQRRKDWL